MLSTSDIKLVSEYTALNFNECIELDCITFKMLLKDAFVHRMSKTEEGREYLEKAYILSQSSPDRESLRKQFSGQGGGK